MLGSMMDELHINYFWILTFYVALTAIMTSARSTGYRSPTFKTGNKTINTHVGETAVLPCSVRNLGTKEVIWKKQKQKHVITIGEYVFIADNSYSVGHKKKRQNWDLVIKNVQKKHAGKYECQISTKEDRKVVIDLVVSDPQPKPSTSAPIVEVQTPAVHISGENFVDKGDSIVLSCNATGKLMTPDDVDWFKDGIKLRPSASDGIFITKYRKADTKTLYSTLEIKHSKMSDKATYLCRSTDLIIAHHELLVLNADTDPQKRDNGHNEEIKTPTADSYLNGTARSSHCSASFYFTLLLVLFKWKIYLPR